MSEQSSQQPDQTTVHDPQAAGFPAEKSAVASGPPPGDESPAEAELGLPPGDHADLDPPHDLRPAPRLTSPARRGKRLIPAQDAQRLPFTPSQRLLILDSWSRSGLPAGDFAPLVGLSKHTLYAWKKRFDQLGPAGLTDQPRGGSSGSKLPELTKRTILLLKQSHPDWGCQKISDMLLRGPALPASPTAVARVLGEAGYVLDDLPAHRTHTRMALSSW